MFIIWHSYWHSLFTERDWLYKSCKVSDNISDFRWVFYKDIYLCWACFKFLYIVLHLYKCSSYRKHEFLMKRLKNHKLQCSWASKTHLFTPLPIQSNLFYIIILYYNFIMYLVHWNIKPNCTIYSKKIIINIKPGWFFIVTGN